MLIHKDFALVASFQFGIGSNYDCHVYALNTAEGAILIDSGSGMDTPALLAQVNAAFPGKTVNTIVLTHSHADHACGASSIQAATGCRILSPDVCHSAIENGDEEYSGLREAREMGLYPPEMKMSRANADIYIDGQSFEVCGHTITPIRVRGHSEDSHCLLIMIGGARYLFAGDAVFYGGVLGVINRFDSGMTGYRTDLAKLAGLEVEGLFPGHGLFTLKAGQGHIDQAIEAAKGGFLPVQVGQKIGFGL